MEITVHDLIGNIVDLSERMIALEQQNAAYRREIDEMGEAKFAMHLRIEALEQQVSESSVMNKEQ